MVIGTKDLVAPQYVGSSQARDGRFFTTEPSEARKQFYFCINIKSEFDVCLQVIS